MSDFTDDVIEGIFCQNCGDYMGDGEGYPVTCSACLADNNQEDK